MATTRGSLQVKDGKYYAVLSFKTDEIQANGKPKYKTKWFCTGYTVKGNKKRAEHFLEEKRNEYDRKNLNYSDLYFADYIELWLKNIKPELRPQHTEVIRAILIIILFLILIAEEQSYRT